MEEKSQRQIVIDRIKELEYLGEWNKDVEDDPETLELKPNKVDYLSKKLSSKIATKIANICATNYFEKSIKKNQLIIENINGIENFLSVKSGAIITCNHFNPNDNYAVWRAIKPYMGKNRLFKVVREGNYTNFPGLIGFFFRHCNTLPLSSNMETMKNFLSAVGTLLKDNQKILIYPEQSMWWNYKKPRPLKNGAFKLAVSNEVPVIPVFITMRDSEIISPDGGYVQKYTIHFLKPIYPDKNLSKSENTKNMMEENYNVWKKTYEEFYQEKLVYNTKEE